MTDRQTALAFPPLRRDPDATFVPGRATESARAALARWRDWPGGALALVGPHASGKSHLAAVWARARGAVPIEAAAIPAPPPQGPLVVEGADAVAHGLALLRLLDAGRDGTAGPLLFTARAEPSAWSTTVPDLRSRLRALAFVRLGDPSDEELLGVLVKLLADRGVELEPGVAEFVVRRIERSFAAAAAVADALDQAGLERQRPLTRALARELLAAGAGGASDGPEGDLLPTAQAHEAS